jgi:Histidine kinase-, DNA gyrase B-, and HSP90-like ATPase
MARRDNELRVMQSARTSVISVGLTSWLGHFDRNQGRVPAGCRQLVKLARGFSEENFDDLCARFIYKCVGLFAKISSALSDLLRRVPTKLRQFVSLTSRMTSDFYARDHLDVVPGPYVILAISDTGVGISPEARSRIFEPFFTTKPAGHGTGLGLSTVYAIVKKVQGHVWFYSELGQGTTFKIYLPRVNKPVEMIRRDKTPVQITANVATILLVEDEERLQRSINPN